MASGNRKEFKMGGDFVAAHPRDYKRFFVVGRLVRIPIVLIAGWMLFRMFDDELRQAGWIAAILYLSSPMTLGHGWLIMPDSISAVAMIGLLKATLEWLQDRKNIGRFTLVGLMWVIAQVLTRTMPIVTN